LERLAGDYGRAHGIAVDRARRWLSLVSFAGALDRVRANDSPRFLIKGGASMELRLGLRARTTGDVDIVFRGGREEMLDALEEAFVQPYGNFSFRRKGQVEDIRGTGSRRLAVQVGFAGRDWQTLQIEVAPPEAAESELVPVAIGIADFKLDGPERVACLSLRYQIAQKIHAVTEQPSNRTNLRFWDLIDLILLRELFEGELARVREACIETFVTRQLHTWPPELVVPEGWRDPYAKTAEEIEADLPTDAAIAAEEIRAFIAAIDSAA
jgi:nucleotidyltransferase AbiEii toxin of type IV toxin-antitoxin system